MFNSDILELAITLCFLYFLLSLLASTINEIVNGFRNVRSRYLEDALKNLFFDDDWKLIYSRFIKSPYIQSLQKTPDKFPSYIPSENFALALSEIIRTDKTKYADVRNMLDAVNQNDIIKGDAKTVILGILNKSGDNYQNFIKGLENIFNNAMDRLSGMYKKSNRKIVMVISFIIVIILNVDTIQITNTLWKDKDALKRSTEIVLETTKNFDTVNTNVYALGDNKNDTLAQKIVNDYNKIKDIEIKVKKMPVPIGWDNANIPNRVNNNYVFQWISKICGWILTAFALFLGAPFWFDTLNRLTNLRAVGNKPDNTEKDKK